MKNKNMAQITKPMLLDETGKQIVTELQNLTKAISGGGSNTPSTPSYTGHVDVDGLKSIGWDDNDIAQFKVCWNEEQDEAFKVTDYDKWYYDYLKTTFGKDLIITDDNKANLLTLEAQDCIHFMPKVNTSSVTDMKNMFKNCYSLVSVPQFDTSSVTTIRNMFNSCYSLVSVPKFDTSIVTNMGYMFNSCYSLVSVPQFDTSSVTDMFYMFSGCDSLVSVPQFNTSNVTNMGYMFNSCYSLVSVPQFDTSIVTNMIDTFRACYSLVSVNTGIKFANILSSTQKSFNGQTFINLIERANNTSAINQTLYMNAAAAKQLYELSCNIDESSTWMTKNDGSQSAQTWLAAQAARTDKTHSSYAITLSFASGSSDYSGQ